MLLNRSKIRYQLDKSCRHGELTMAINSAALAQPTAENAHSVRPDLKVRARLHSYLIRKAPYGAFNYEIPDLP